MSRLGTKQYGSEDWLEAAAYGFNGGINCKAVPQELDDADLTSCVNVYLRSDGGIEQRKGYSSVGGPITLVSAGASPSQGLVRFIQSVFNNAPATPYKKWLLQQYNTRNIIDATTGAAPAGVANPVFVASALPWNTAVILDGDHVGAGSNVGASDVLIIANGDPNGPFIYDGANAPYRPAGWAGVAGAKYVQVVNNIVWFSGMPIQPNLVYGTLLGHPEQLGYAFSMSAVVNGLSILGSGAQAALCVGMSRGLSLIYGTYPGNYTQQDIPVNDGVTSGRAMIAIYGMVYFLGRQAIYVFDGQSAPQRISDKVEPWILGDPYATFPSYAMQGDRSQYWAFYYNNKIFWVYDTAGVGVLSTMLCYDLVNQGWTIQVPNDPMVAYASLNGPGDPSPEQGVILSQSSGQPWFWDTYAGGLSTADAWNGTTGVNIPASFQTKYFKVGVPGTPKRIMRWYPEFFAGTTSFTLSVINDYGTSSQVGAFNSIGGTYFYDSVSSLYGSALWSTGTRSFFGAPATRTDLNLQGEAFSFGVSSNGQNQPWVFQGFSLNYAQEARV